MNGCGRENSLAEGPGRALRCRAPCMKPVPLLLAVSVAANLGLLALWLSERATPAAPAIAAEARPGAPATPGEDTERAAAAAALRVAVDKGDAAGVRDQLRALGLPDDVIRATVRAVLFKPVAERSRELSARYNDDGRAYWKTPAGMLAPAALSREDRTWLREANRGALRQLEALMGPDPHEPSMARLGFLPPEKAARLRAIEADYAELRAQVMGDTEGFRTDEDETRLAFLEDEQRRDLAALLSPEELAEFDRRASRTADRVRAQLRGLDVSEEEYKAIFAAQKAFDDAARAASRPPGRAPVAGSLPPPTYREAQQQLQESLRRSLGEARYAEYRRAQDPAYQSLQAAARRYNLPSTAVTQAYTARERAVAASQRIAADASLSPAERTRQLALAAEQTRSEVRTALGPDVGNTYLAGQMPWLDGMAQGTPVRVSADGLVVPSAAGRPSADAPVSGPRPSPTPPPVR